MCAISVLLVSLLACASGFISLTASWEAHSIGRRASPLRMMADKPKTFKRFMQVSTWRDPELEALYPILLSIESSCRDINRLTRRISSDGLSGLAGGAVNIQGEEQKQLDVVANRIMKTALCGSGKVSIIASEEEDEACKCSDVVQNMAFNGEYAAVFDPLDGSSNLDSGLPTGTIFGIYKNPAYGSQNDPDRDIVKQEGRELVVAGYCLYSAATHLVITVRSGLHQFTLDDVTGDFYLTKENIKIPRVGSIYSFNAANQDNWHHSTQKYFTDFSRGRVSTYDLAKRRNIVNRYNAVTKQVYQEFESSTKALYRQKQAEVERLNEADVASAGVATERAQAAAAAEITPIEELDINSVKPSARYMGALVADAHNIICNGGIFAYPGTIAKPRGKIRLLYEANPMAMIFEQGGGMASNGYQRILDLPLPDIHMRTPCFFGSIENVAALQRYSAFYDPEP